MRVMVVGSGGREHTLAWKLAASPRVTGVWVAPGNAGTAEVAQNVPWDGEGLEDLAARARDLHIDLTVVGPEAPLVAGLADVFRRKGLAVFGPSAGAAALEGSKAFAKDLMRLHGIPTAEYAVFDQVDEARRFLHQHGAPVVVKADGLAAGKGVVVARELEPARQALDWLMQERAFGAAGERVVLEELLEGEEVTVMALCDGKRVVPLAAAQDHKRASDGDRGPNTGGMGCYSPVPSFTPRLARQVEGEILRPTVEAMAAAGLPFQGTLYAGLMLTEQGPRVLEFNARFGDPESQVVLPRLQSDLASLLLACVEGRLDGVEPDWYPGAAVCVIMASGGYPGAYEQGFPIQGLAEVRELERVLVFHAGTARHQEQVVTAGGRVLGVTGMGEDLGQARETAYQGVRRLRFSRCHYRSDIARRAGKHSS